MEDNNKFLGGMNQDVHPSNQPNNTSRYTLNFVPLSKEGNLYSITNEQGTVLFNNISFPPGMKVIGHSVLNTDIIVVLATEGGASQIGIIKDDSDLHPIYGKYHPIAPVNPDGSVPNNNTELGFNPVYPVDCVSRKLINGHRILYFTDNNMPFGRVDLDSPPLVGSVSQEVKLTFNQRLPRIEVSEIRENTAGTLRPGVYFFVTRYITETGGTTSFGIPSDPFPVVPTTRDLGPDRYAGAFYEDMTINKNLVINITNVDTQYRELELVAIYYEGSQSVFRATIVGQIPITGDSISFTFTGPDAEGELHLTREELRRVPISYTRAKCIEQKDSILYLSNLASDRQSYDDVLQGIANQVRVRYRIEETQFSSRGDNSQITNLAFVPNFPFLSDIRNLQIVFSKDVDPTTVGGSFVLHKPGLAATASISIDDNNLLLDGDEIIIGAGPSQPSVTFIARTGIPGLNEFQIGVDAENTASNIAAAILGSTDVSYYVAGSVLNTVTLVWSVVDNSANGVTVVTTGSGITTTNFGGGNEVPFTVNPTNISISDRTINLEFLLPIASNDELQITNVLSTEGDVFSTGEDGLLPIVFEPQSSVGGTLSPGFTDYVNEFMTSSRKGYRRKEVYSLAFALLYKDGSTSFSYHIPGYVGYVSESGGKFPPTGGDAWPSFSQSPVSSGLCGTYVSSADYPLLQNYPGDQPGDDSSTAGPGTIARKIRHHLMPSLSNEPHFRVDGNGITWIRTLGLEFQFTVPIPQYILEDVEEIIFLRERRSNNTNSSVLAQGIINRQVVSADAYSNDGTVELHNISGGTIVVNPKDGYYAMEMPFFDNLRYAYITGPRVKRSSGSTYAGLAYPWLPGAALPEHNGSYQDGKAQQTHMFADRAFFHSPETVLLSGFRLSPDTVIAASLEPEMNFIGDYNRISFMQHEWQSQARNDFLSKYMYSDFFGDYRNYETTLSATTRVIQRARFADPGKLRIPALDPIDEPSLKTGTRWSAGGLEIKLDGDLDHAGGVEFMLENGVEIRDGNRTSPLNRWRRGYIRQLDFRDTGGGVKEGVLRRYLYNIVLNNAQQYGQLAVASYIPISRQTPRNPNGSFRLTYSGIYGGDTFITKFSYNGGQLVHYTGYNREADWSINRPSRSQVQRPSGYDHIDGISRLGTTEGVRAWGIDLRWTTYFFVESNINTYYRHRPSDEERQDYFPNQIDLGALLENFRPYLGEVRAYNTQYSYENNTKEFFVKGSTQSLITKFENRTIYSEQAAADDTLDAYRSFLQNNFYDLPSNTGPIWDTFVEFNSLFMHTPKSLWRTFAEPAATLQGGNISDVVLGTGSLFARPSIQILTTEGGYAGTISQFGGAHTQIGYIFPDVLQGKVFALAISDNGPHLKELSMDGLQTFMHTNLPLGLIKTGDTFDLKNITTETAHLIDNPFIGIGINGGYDYKLRRYFLIKHGGFTVTFSVVTNNWFSFHSYDPNLIVPFDNRVLFFRNNTTLSLWEMNIGARGSYFGVVYPSELEYAVAPNTGSTSTFQNVVVVSDSYQGNLKIRDNNFSTLQVYNDRMNSGINYLIHGNVFNVNPINGQLLIKHRNDEYRLFIPRDSVVDNSQDLFDPNNIYIPNGGNVPVDSSYGFRERIKGDHAIFKFVYDNAPNIEFVLNYITTIFNINQR